MINFREKILEIFCPDISCLICGKDLSKTTKTHICDECKKAIPFIKNSCKKCGKDVQEYDSCSFCISRKFYFDRAIAVVNYEGNIISCFYRLKKISQRYFVKFMSYYMVCAYKNANIKADSIVCVPSTNKMLKDRGFNQAHDLMLLCNDYLHLADLSNNIVQIKNVKNQKRLNLEDRIKIAQDKYKIVHPSKFKGKSVLIIDDVLTTGATVDSIAQKLKYSGASKVYVLTFATVPSKKSLKEIEL